MKAQQRASTPAEIKGPVHKGAPLPSRQSSKIDAADGGTSKQPPVPTPDRGKGSSGPSAGAAAPPMASIGLRLAKGVGHAGKGAASNGGGITAIMAATFAIVAIAKIRGTANISTSHALFGGFILLFLLTLMYKFAPGVAMGFAVLVLITALLDYGVDAFNGLFGKGSGIPAAEQTGNVTGSPDVPDPQTNAAAYMKMYPGSSVTSQGVVIPPAL